MKKMFLSTLLIIGITLGFSQSKVEIDPGMSSIEWTGKKVTGSHNGLISFTEGNLIFEEDVLVGGNFTADMTTLTVEDIQGEMADKLKGHLMSDDFFSIDSYPSATLQFTEVVKLDGSKYNVVGDLTIKGITKPVKFEMEAAEGSAKANVVIDRTDYGIQYGSGSFFDNLGDKMIYDNFDLLVKLAY